MLIDWFTVGAQLLNFLILVWLLKRYLYGPILKAIDAREQRIAAQLADAAKKQAEALQERETFEDKNTHFDEQRAALLVKAGEDAKRERERLLSEAQQAATALRAKQAAALQAEWANLGKQLTQQVVSEVFAIARKALGDLAGTDLETRIAEVFVQRLKNLDAGARAAISAASKASSETAVLRSRFELPAAAQAALANAVNVAFSADVRLNFEVAANCIGGIELSVGGQKLAWSIADYLDSLQQKMTTLIGDQATPTVKTAPTLCAAPPAATSKAA